MSSSIAGFSLARPPEECNPFPVDQRKEVRKPDTKTYIRHAVRTDDKMDFIATAAASFLDRPVRERDGFFHIQSVQVDFAGLALLIVLCNRTRMLSISALGFTERVYRLLVEFSIE